MRLSMHLQLRLIAAHDLLAAVGALVAVSLAICAAGRKEGGRGTYDGGRLRWLDGQAVGLDGDAGAGGFGFLVLALDLGWVLVLWDGVRCDGVRVCDAMRCDV